MSDNKIFSKPENKKNESLVNWKNKWELYKEAHNGFSEYLVYELNYQQKKIDSLEDQLQWSIKNEQQYKDALKLCQKEFDDAIRKINALEKKLQNNPENKKNESFEEWFKEAFPSAYRSNPYEARAKEAWNHQQKKIEHYKKIAMDNQARYSGALERIAELEKKTTLDQATVSLNLDLMSALDKIETLKAAYLKASRLIDMFKTNMVRVEEYQYHLTEFLNSPEHKAAMELVK